MSSHRSPSNGIEVPILAGAAAFLGFCFWIAQISGASLASVMKSAFGLIGLAVVVGGALWWLKDYFFIGAAFYLVVGWRVVWPVLDSIAAGGHEGEDWPLMPYENTFMASGWLNWSVESILIAVFIYGISRRGRDSYYARRGHIMTTYRELKKQIAALTDHANAVRATEFLSVVNEIRAMVAEYGITEKDIFPAHRGRPRKHQPRPPKYRDPQTGATWSGRGRPPAWIRGKTRERFEIKG